MSFTTDTPRLSRTEAAALLAEVQALHQLVRELTVPRMAGGIDPSLPAGQLAEAIWQACGRRKSLWVRTRLCQLAEAEGGIRVRGRGRDRVSG
jgi:hypothetical protein